MVWGIWKRAGRNIMEDRLFLLDSIVKAGVMYGVEIWGLGEIKMFERIQSRYCKMALGVNRTTPKYIWRRELGIPSMEFMIRERALRYIKEVLEMEDSRWPKICVMEEIRAITNGNPSKWGENLVSVLREMGIEDLIEMIRERRDGGRIGEKIKTGLEELKRRSLREEEEKIRESGYNDLYKYLIEGDEMPWKYWSEEGIGGGVKEVWARVRCGNLGRAGKKGEKDWKCRLCREHVETLEHLIICDRGRELISGKARKEVEEWMVGVEEGAIRGEVINMLGGKIQVGMCGFFREVEELCRRRRVEEDGREGEDELE